MFSGGNRKQLILTFYKWKFILSITKLIYGLIGNRLDRSVKPFGYGLQILQAT